MEVVGDIRDVYFEVSSPGVNRDIKSAGEFAVFIGRSVKILCDGDSEWIYGDILNADDKNVILELSNKIDNILFIHIAYTSSIIYQEIWL